jgi:hypothetical protein
MPENESFLLQQFIRIVAVKHAARAQFPGKKEAS